MTRFKPIAALIAAVASISLISVATVSAGLKVAVSIAPQQYFVQRIAGDRAEVQVMIPPGASPATYEPKPRQLAALTGASLYLAIGVPFETAWLKRMTAVNPGMAIVYTDQGIEKHAMARHGHLDGDRHEADSHVAAGATAAPDPHIWLSPPLVKIQARHIAAALIRLDPDHRDAYRARIERFTADLDRLHEQLKTLLAPCRKAPFMVFHPSWGYFARTYDLIQVPIEIEGKAPKAAELERIIGLARRQGIRTLFVQPQFSTKSARMVARAIGGRIVVADPLAVDWAANLRQQAAAFRSAIVKEAP